MKMRSVLVAAAVVAPMVSAGAAQASLVANFTGMVSQFNTGPFNAFDTFSGSFELDETVVGTGGSTVVTFANAVDNLVLNIAGETVTGSDGQYRQQGGGGTEFAIFTFSSVVGANLSGTGPGTWVPTRVSFDLRSNTGDIYTNIGDMTDGFDLSDLSTVIIRFQFDDSSTPGTDESGTIGGVVAASFTSFTLGAQNVAEPAALGLFGLGLVGLGLAARRRR